MYTPKQFQNTNTAEVLDFIRENSFGTLITSGERTTATHIPLELDASGKFLYGHLSAANPQVRELESDHEVLCIFLGPHAYISSSWYNHENVPTWNYIAVHVYGKVNIIGEDEAVDALKTLVNKYEKDSEKPVSVERLSPDYLSKSLRGIFAFRIDITSIKASYKLSQNRDKTNHTSIVKHLEKRSGPFDRAVAAEMKKHAPKE